MVDLLLYKTLRLTAAVVAPVVSVLAIRYLHRRWQLKLSRKERQLLGDMAWAGVRFVEQEYRHHQPGPDLNREKYTLAERYLQTLAARKGIDLDPDTARVVIEAAVLEMRRGGATASTAPAPAQRRMDGPGSDDLTRVEGIGPRVARILRDDGIGGLRELAAVEPARLRELLKRARLPFIDPSSWPEQARHRLTGLEGEG